MTWKQTFRPVVFALFLATQLAAQHAINCGTEGKPACIWKDWEKYNMRFWVEDECDFDLQPVNGVCVNQSRRANPPRDLWANWAVRQQLRHIGANDLINFLQWPGAHNAFSSMAQGFSDPLTVNQYWSITDQLQFGVRHLELDPHYYGGLGRQEVRLCHASDTFLCGVPGWPTRLFSLAMDEINNWLAAHPGDFIIIKLDDKLNDPFFGDGLNQLSESIRTYLGPRVLQPPAASGRSFTRWPTPAEFGGKQVMFTINNTGPRFNPWVWDSYGLVLEDNHPKAQNFTNCTDSAGKNPGNRSLSRWWDTAEGRTGSNLPGNPENLTSNTGLFRPAARSMTVDDRRVSDAVNCGVSIVGMDFVNALNAPVFFPDNVPDTRLNEAVWSWKPGDFGQTGPAMLQQSSSRWVSRSQTELHPFACGLVRSTPTAPQDRNWKVTAGSYPWSKIVGDQICQQEFGSNYAFSFPTNGWQNRELKSKIDGDVWLSYSVAPTVEMTVAPNVFPVTMLRGSTPPAEVTFDINGAPGMTISVDAGLPSWLSVTLPATPLVLGSVPVTARIAVTAAASSLPAGLYDTNITVRGVYPNYPQSVASIAFTLFVKDPSTTTLTGPTSVPWNSNFTLTAKTVVPNTVNPAGVLDLLLATPEQGGGFTTSVTQSTILGSNGGQFAFSVSGQRPPGQYVFAARYRGSDNATSSESEPLYVTILPRTSSPASIDFRMPAAGPLPVYQGATMNGLTAPNSVYKTGDCNWLLVDAFAGGAKFNVDTPALTKPVGTYNCQVQIKDSQTGVGGYFDIPVTLTVTGTLNISPTVLNLTALAGGPPVAGLFGVTANSNAPALPVQFTSTQPWLAAATGQDNYGNITPLPSVTALVNPAALAAGSYIGFIQVTSALAATATVRVNLTVVNGTTITTNPPGIPFVADGVGYSAATTFPWAAGSQHSLSIQGGYANAGTQYQFNNWSNGVNTSSFTYTAIGAGGTLTANYNTAGYFLTVNPVPSNGGSVTIVPNALPSYYPPGTPVQLTAVPASGYQFSGWAGALSGTALAGSITMNAPQSVTAAFTPITSVSVKFSSATPGAAVTVNGVVYNLPVTISAQPGANLAIGAQSPVAGTPGTRAVFATWSDGGPQSHNVTVPPAGLDLQLAYKTQYLVSVAASPLAGGVITGSQWYDVGSTAILTATPNSGYVFNGFSGGITGAANPQNVTVTAPVNATANFGPSGRPTLVVQTAAPRAEAGTGKVTVPLTINNLGTAAALDVRIVSVSAFVTTAGTGAVTSSTDLPVLFGDLSPAASATQSLSFDWPSTATRIRFTVSYVANGGAFTASTTVNIFR